MGLADISTYDFTVDWSGAVGGFRGSRAFDGRFPRLGSFLQATITPEIPESVLHFPDPL